MYIKFGVFFKRRNSTQKTCFFKHIFILIVAYIYKKMTMIHRLINLSYETNALEPYMSAETLEFHYGKHHRAYVNTLNTLIEWTDFTDKTLEEIIVSSEWKIFNNAAQIWNHNLFWNTLKINNWSRPEWKLAEMIDASFGSFEAMKEKFKAESLGRFGSGWVWLVQKWDSLEIYSTPNAENPLTEGWEALLWCDVWEHSYYIDTRNDRGQYIENFWNIVDWDVVAGRIK